MTCPDLDRLVDAAVAGVPGAAERLGEHADACAACLAEADCEHAPVPELALLADAHCPPDVVAAALAEAARPVRVAPDRPAERAASRPARPVWTRRIAIGVAFAAALLVLRAAWPDHRAETPQVAVAPDAPSRPLGPDVGTQPGPVEIAAVPQPLPSAPQGATPRIAAPRIAAPRIAAPLVASRPTPSTAPVRRPVAPDSSAVVAPPTTEGVAPDGDMASVSPADSAAARSDLLLALAIVGRAQRTADAAVSAEMRRVSDALEPARTL